ncbi:hypothetical protein [Methyloversatilis sp.]
METPVHADSRYQGAKKGDALKDSTAGFVIGGQALDLQGAR